MKKILSFILMLAVAVPVLADGRSEDVLAQLAAKMRSLGDYHATFQVEAEGNMLDGSYSVDGDKYYMHTDEYEVICDGKARYEVNHFDQEVVVDNVNTGDRNILSNPTRAFDFASDLFTSRYVGEENVGGSIADVIELTPLDEAGALKRVTVKIDRATGLPAQLRYLSDGLSEDVVIRILDIRKGVAKDASFRFERARYKDYEVVDFR